MDQYNTMTGDYSWLDPALYSQTTDNMDAANDARVPAPDSYNMHAAHPGPYNIEPTHHASAPSPGLNKMETVNEARVPPPDYSQVFDPAKLSELWAVSP
jgi:hypothetical protein